MDKIKNTNLWDYMISKAEFERENPELTQAMKKDVALKRRHAKLMDTYRKAFKVKSSTNSLK